jgi:cytochrome c peroxidase
VRRLGTVGAVLALLAGCGDVGSAATAATVVASTSPTSPRSFYATPFERTPTVAELTGIGRRLFFDPGLSASGKLSCADCHDPRYAYGSREPMATPRGGLDNTQRGFRATPSLRYLQSVPVFTEHLHDADGDDSVDQGPAGGHTWDGRAQSAHEQARLPLFSPLEMANPNPAAIIGRLRRATYADQLRDTFGEHVLDDEDIALNAVLLALEVFQQDPSEFYPYSSKYDDYIRGRVSLTRRERHGLELFNDPKKGNCASCHPSAIKQGAFPAFSDFGYVALGAPRNRDISANRDPHFHDLGLCGPERTDLATRTEYCGLFRTSSLRNVALRRSYFHNGSLHDLAQVVRFYAERDVHPEKWYPRAANGAVKRFDDLPPQYHANINRDAPFDRGPGDRPALSTAEIEDVVAFLRTLTDGYERPNDGPGRNAIGSRTPP